MSAKLEVALTETISRIGALREAMDGVPFGQSEFQNTYLADGAETPERRMRYVLLQLDKKMQALVMCSYRRRRLEIDLRELRERIGTASGYAAERIKVDIDEKEYALGQEVKLVKDALIEANTFYGIYESLPKVGRDAFEKAEHGYWRHRLTTDAQLEFEATGTVSAGTLTALRRIGIATQRRGSKITFKKLSEAALKRISE